MPTLYHNAENHYGIICGNCGQDNPRAEKQDNESDQRQGHHARNSGATTHLCRRLAVQGLRQTLSGQAGHRRPEGPNNHRCARMLLAPSRMRRLYNAEKQRQVLDGEMVQKCQARQAKREILAGCGLEHHHSMGLRAGRFETRAHTSADMRMPERMGGRNCRRYETHPTTSAHSAAPAVSKSRSPLQETRWNRGLLQRCTLCRRTLEGPHSIAAINGDHQLRQGGQ